jgi:hypothetical protein
MEDVSSGFTGYSDENTETFGCSFEIAGTGTVLEDILFTLPKREVFNRAWQKF